MNDNQPGDSAPVAPAPVEPVVPAAPAAPVAPVAPVAPLADDTKDRTKEQFDKLLESNRRLAEDNANKALEIARRDEMDRVFTPQASRPTQPAPIDPKDFIEKDPVTGQEFINVERLRERLEETNTKAVRAEEIINKYIAETQDKEVQRQNEEAFSAYPELDPNGKKFDVNFTKHVRGILQDSMWNVNDYGGKPLSFKAAADFVKGSLKPADVAPAAPTEEEAAIAKAEADAAQLAKDQASANPTAQPGNASRQNANDNAELENLRYRTRYLNDDTALAERIKHTEHILPKEAQQT